MVAVEEGLLLTTYYSLLTTYYSLLTVLTTHYSLPTTHYLEHVVAVEEGLLCRRLEPHLMPGGREGRRESELTVLDQC